MNSNFGLLVAVTIVMLAITTGLVFFIVAYSRRVLQHRETLKSKEKEKQMALLNATIDAQEVERARIGSDIHDDIGPLLSTLKLYVNKIKLIEDTTERNAYIDSLGAQMDEVIGEIRRVAKDLVPMVLIEFGLVAALENLCERINRSEQILAFVEVTSSLPRLSQNEQLALYRIVQEFCNNSIRYAEASQIRIVLEADPLQLSMIDNGIGFDKAKVQSSEQRGIGLRNMTARAEAIEADFILESALGEGTTATITLKDRVHV